MCAGVTIAGIPGKRELSLAAKSLLLGENLRGAAEALAEGFIEGDGGKLPSPPLAFPIELPFAIPAECLLVPDQMRNQHDFAALFGGCFCQLCRLDVGERRGI